MVEVDKFKGEIKVINVDEGEPDDAPVAVSSSQLYLTEGGKLFTFLMYPYSVFLFNIFGTRAGPSKFGKINIYRNLKLGKVEETCSLFTSQWGPLKSMKHRNS